MVLQKSAIVAISFLDIPNRYIYNVFVTVKDRNWWMSKIHSVKVEIHIVAWSI